MDEVKSDNIKYLGTYFVRCDIYHIDIEESVCLQDPISTGIPTYLR